MNAISFKVPDMTGQGRAIAGAIRKCFVDPDKNGRISSLGLLHILRVL
jgi:hypothetical protein